MRTGEIAAINKAISILHSDDARNMFKTSFASQQFPQTGATQQLLVAQIDPADLKSKNPPCLQIKADLKKSLELAEVLNLVETPKMKAVAAFQQTSVDPDDPEYKYHSQRIIDVASDLLKDFNAEKKAAALAWKGHHLTTIAARKAKMRRGEKPWWEAETDPTGDREGHGEGKVDCVWGLPA